jgi:hypothetical protein
MPIPQRKRGRKRPEDVVDPVLKRMYQVSGWTTQAQVCRELDEVESTLSRSLGRGDGVPEILLFKLCYCFPVRLEWLRWGTGEMYRDQIKVGDLAAPLQRAVRLMRDAPDEVLDLLERVARLVAIGQAEPINAIKITVMGAELHSREAAEMEADVPDSM